MAFTRVEVCLVAKALTRVAKAAFQEVAVALRRVEVCLVTKGALIQEVSSVRVRWGSLVTKGALIKEVAVALTRVEVWWLVAVALTICLVTKGA